MEATSQPSEEEQIKEYETQLADVLELLQATPGDAALLSLKSDLEELLVITRQSWVRTTSLQQQQAASAAAAAPAFLATLQPTRAGLATSTDVLEKALAAAVETSVGSTAAESAQSVGSFAATALASAMAAEASAASDFNVNGDSHDDSIKRSMAVTDAGVDRSTTAPAQKKAKVVAAVKEEFELPPHLIVHDTDTEKERNRKRRAAKALKNKWREMKREVESEKKQKSWQSFSKKQKMGSSLIQKEKSIFSTQEGSDAKVGVVTVAAGRQLTEFDERKRHKHT